MNHEEAKLNNFPDGDYTGRVYVKPNKVADEKSLDYERSQLAIELTPTGDDFTDEIVLLNRVLMPNYLVAEPPKGVVDGLAKQLAASQIYLEQTNKLLEKCGVEISSRTEGTLLMQQIARNNSSRPIVSFTMKDGVPTIHKVVSREKPEALNAELEALPDGNDAPI